MKLIRWKKEGKTVPGIVLDNQYYDVSALKRIIMKAFSKPAA